MTAITFNFFRTLGSICRGEVDSVLVCQICNFFAQEIELRSLTATLTATRMEIHGPFNTRSTLSLVQVNETTRSARERTPNLPTTNQKVGCSNHSGRTIRIKSRAGVFEYLIAVTNRPAPAIHRAERDAASLSAAGR
jgi:hypothetical protein